MREWIYVDADFHDKLPKEDCEIWITRICFTGGKWVQKVKYYADSHDIEWDGTVAWMIAGKNDIQPEPCERYYMTVQTVR